MEYTHDELVKYLALRIEGDSRYALVKYFTPANDTKTDLIGAFYPDVTTLRREGKTKLMVEVLTQASWEDSDEIRRLENLSQFCQTNNWEFYLACSDEKARDLTARKIEGKNVRPRAVWLINEAPFEQIQISQPIN
jgi:hypothetical protein